MTDDVSVFPSQLLTVEVLRRPFESTQVLRVSVQTGADVVFGAPQLVFEGTYDLTAAGDLHYSASPDREQFLMVVEESATTLRMVFNWLGDLGS